MVTKLNYMDQEKEEKVNIRSIVVSGGGQNLMTFFGVLKRAFQTDYLNWSNIESIYGTSAGALILAVISLKIDMNILDEYLKKRPWDKLFNMNIDTCIDAYDKKGIFDVGHFYSIFEPLLKSQDLDINITLKEFYEFNQVDLHIYATEMNSFTYVDFSHTTHPDWKLIDVVYASACIPVMFSPTIVQDKCYIDGGPTMDFPIDIACQRFSKEEIFAIKKVCKNTPNDIDESMHLLDFVQTCFGILLRNKIMQKSSTKIENTVYVPGIGSSMSEILNMTSKIEIREDMIETGEKLFDEFIPVKI